MKKYGLISLGCPEFSVSQCADDRGLAVNQQAKAYWTLVL